jgi:integrase
MASLHKDPQGRSKFWYCAFSEWDADEQRWQRRFRSTKTANKDQALQICRTWEQAAKTAQAGRLTPDRAREILANGLEGIFLASNREPMKRYTIRQWGRQWLDSKLIENAPRTHERYAGIITRFYEHLGSKADRDIASVTASEITAFRDKLAKELSINTANLAVKTLRVCFGAAYSNDLVTSNTAAKVKKLKQPRMGHRREFKPAEIRLLLQAAGDSEWRGMILTALYSGQRLGDVSRLRWGDVRLDTREIVFRVSKTNEILPLPMARPLSDYLEGLPSSDDANSFLFPKAAACTRTGMLSNQFYKVMEQAGLVPQRKNVDTGKGHRERRAVSSLSFHSLRHSCVTFLKAAGVSDAVAQAIAGHASSAVSRIYTHLDVETLRGAVAKLPDVTKGEKKR